MICLGVLDKRTQSLDSKQSEEIFRILAKNEIKNEERVILEFDIWAKEIVPKLICPTLEEKKIGMKEVMNIFGKTLTFKEQLKLFGAKTSQHLINQMISNIDQASFKDDPLRHEFVKCLIDLLPIFDSFVNVELDNGSQQYFKVDYISDQLTQMEGLFGTIATITNFLMLFQEDTEILEATLCIFKRLYNFFPNYRKHLEHPILNILASVLVNYSKIIA